MNDLYWIKDNASLIMIYDQPPRAGLVPRGHRRPIRRRAERQDEARW